MVHRVHIAGGPTPLDPMIIRTWRGAVRAEDTDRYLAYLRQTGLRSYASTPGNRGSWVWRRPIEGGTLTELVVCSRWDSMDAVRAFAGADVERAVFYPEDDRFLVQRDEHVVHYEESDVTTEAGRSAT